MRDPGLQPERTGLAWIRTGFSMLVVAALSVPAGIVKSELLPIAAGALASFGACVLLFSRQGRLDASRSFDTTAIVRRAAMTTSVICVFISILYMAAVLLSVLSKGS